MHTFPFYELINENSDAWSLVHGFYSLYPTNVHDLLPEMIDNINEHFYYREIAFSSPTKFLRAFHRLVKERAYIWRKFLISEKMLTDNDMIRNYDLTETYEGNNINENTNDSTTTTKPNLNMETTTTNETKNRLMDTPDGITDDIENYMTEASKDNTTDHTLQHQSGENETNVIGTNNGTNHDEHTLRRFGNIGIQTSADILKNTREAMIFDTYENVIFPEVGQLFLSVIDLDEIELW